MPNEQPTTRTCDVCDLEAENACPCQDRHYCSRKCQTVDWKTHKHDCSSRQPRNANTKSSKSRPSIPPKRRTKSKDNPSLSASGMDATGNERGSMFAIDSNSSWTVSTNTTSTHAVVADNISATTPTPRVTQTHKSGTIEHSATTQPYVPATAQRESSPILVPATSTVKLNTMKSYSPIKKVKLVLNKRPDHHTVRVIKKSHIGEGSGEDDDDDDCDDNNNYGGSTLARRMKQHRQQTKKTLTTSKAKTCASNRMSNYNGDESQRVDEGKFEIGDVGRRASANVSTHGRPVTITCEDMIPVENQKSARDVHEGERSNNVAVAMREEMQTTSDGMASLLANVNSKTRGKFLDENRKLSIEEGKDLVVPARKQLRERIKKTKQDMLKAEKDKDAGLADAAAKEAREADEREALMEKQMSEVAHRAREAVLKQRKKNELEERSRLTNASAVADTPKQASTKASVQAIPEQLTKAQRKKLENDQMAAHLKRMSALKAQKLQPRTQLQYDQQQQLHPPRIQTASTYAQQHQAKLGQSASITSLTPVQQLELIALRHAEICLRGKSGFNSERPTQRPATSSEHTPAQNEYRVDTVRNVRLLTSHADLIQWQSKEMSRLVEEANINRQKLNLGQLPSHTNESINAVMSSHMNIVNEVFIEYQMKIFQADNTEADKRLADLHQAAELAWNAAKMQFPLIQDEHRDTFIVNYKAFVLEPQRHQLLVDVEGIKSACNMVMNAAREYGVSISQYPDYTELAGIKLKERNDVIAAKWTEQGDKVQEIIVLNAALTKLDMLTQQRTGAMLSWWRENQRQNDVSGLSGGPAGQKSASPNLSATCMQLSANMNFNGKDNGNVQRRASSPVVYMTSGSSSRCTPVNTPRNINAGAGAGAGVNTMQQAHTLHHQPQLSNYQKQHALQMQHHMLNQQHQALISAQNTQNAMLRQQMASYVPNASGDATRVVNPNGHPQATRTQKQTLSQSNTVDRVNSSSIGPFSTAGGRHAIGDGARNSSVAAVPINKQNMFSSNSSITNVNDSNSNANVLNNSSSTTSMGSHTLNLARMTMEMGNATQTHTQLQPKPLQRLPAEEQAENSTRFPSQRFRPNAPVHNPQLNAAPMSQAASQARTTNVPTGDNFQLLQALLDCRKTCIKQRDELIHKINEIHRAERMTGTSTVQQKTGLQDLLKRLQDSTNIIKHYTNRVESIQSTPFYLPVPTMTDEHRKLLEEHKEINRQFQGAQQRLQLEKTQEEHKPRVAMIQQQHAQMQPTQSTAQPINALSQGAQTIPRLYQAYSPSTAFHNGGTSSATTQIYQSRPSVNHRPSPQRVQAQEDLQLYDSHSLPQLTELPEFFGNMLMTWETIRRLGAVIHIPLNDVYTIYGFEASLLGGQSYHRSRIFLDVLVGLVRNIVMYDEVPPKYAFEKGCFLNYADYNYRDFKLPFGIACEAKIIKKQRKKKRGLHPPKSRKGLKRSNTGCSVIRSSTAPRSPSITPRSTPPLSQMVTKEIAAHSSPCNSESALQSANLDGSVSASDGETGDDILANDAVGVCGKRRTKKEFRNMNLLLQLKANEVHKQCVAQNAVKARRIVVGVSVLPDVWNTEKHKKEKSYPGVVIPKDFKSDFGIPEALISEYDPRSVRYMNDSVVSRASSQTQAWTPDEPGSSPGSGPGSVPGSPYRKRAKLGAKATSANGVRDENDDKDKDLGGRQLIPFSVLSENLSTISSAGVGAVEANDGTHMGDAEVSGKEKHQPIRENPQFNPVLHPTPTKSSEYDMGLGDDDEDQYSHYLYGVHIGRRTVGRALVLYLSSTGLDVEIEEPAYCYNTYGELNDIIGVLKRNGVLGLSPHQRALVCRFLCDQLNMTDEVVKYIRENPCEGQDQDFMRGPRIQQEWRLKPVGVDRFHRRWWYFATIPDRLFCETTDAAFYTKYEDNGDFISHQSQKENYDTCNQRKLVEINSGVDGGLDLDSVKPRSAVKLTSNKLTATTVSAVDINEETILARGVNAGRTSPPTIDRTTTSYDKNEGPPCLVAIPDAEQAFTVSNGSILDENEGPPSLVAANSPRSTCIGLTSINEPAGREGSEGVLSAPTLLADNEGPPPLVAVTSIATPQQRLQLNVDSRDMNVDVAVEGPPPLVAIPWCTTDGNGNPPLTSPSIKSANVTESTSGRRVLVSEAENLSSTREFVGPSQRLAVSKIEGPPPLVPVRMNGLVKHVGNLKATNFKEIRSKADVDRTAEPIVAHQRTQTPILSLTQRTHSDRHQPVSIGSCNSADADSANKRPIPTAIIPPHKLKPGQEMWHCIHMSDVPQLQKCLNLHGVRERGLSINIAALMRKKNEQRKQAPQPQLPIERGPLTKEDFQSDSNNGLKRVDGEGGHVGSMNKYSRIGAKTAAPNASTKLYVAAPVSMVAGSTLGTKSTSSPERASTPVNANSTNLSVEPITTANVASVK
eukprot:CFRG6916T1